MSNEQQLMLAHKGGGESVPNNTVLLNSSDTSKEMPIKNKLVRTKPVLIPVDQRNANRIRKLKNENLKLREKIEHLQIIWGTNSTQNDDSTRQTGIPINRNKFESLIDDDDMDDDDNIDIAVPSTSNATGDNCEQFENFKQSVKRKNEIGPEKQAAKNPKINNNSATITNVDPQMNLIKNSSNKIVKPPPLHLHKQTVRDSLQLMKGVNVEKFEIRRVSSDKHSIIVNTMDDYQKISQLLKEVKTQYFTYTPKTMKPKSLVLKGLTEEEDIEELKADLQSHGEIKIDKIIQLRSRRPNEMGRKLPLYIVQFQPQTNITNIFKIKVLNYQRISWENIRKQNEIMQCRKCQRFGHAALNCNLHYRCVKCVNQHNPGECNVSSKIEQKDIYCINCKKSGHPASFKGCPVYQRMIEKLRSKIREKKNNSQRTFNSVPVNAQNGTFADILKSNGSNQLSVENLAVKMDKMAETIKQQSEQIAHLLQIINSL